VAKEVILSDEAARWILVRGARTLAHDDALVPSLEILLGVMVERLDIESAAVVVADGRSDQPVIIAASGLGEPARAGLNAGLRNQSHPVVKTLSESVATFDVLPSQPGGPALRSHLPLSVTRDGTTRVLGVLALAHHRPLDAEARRLVEAAADLAAVLLERHRPA
jgi:hypothetical protein